MLPKKIDSSLIDDRREPWTELVGRTSVLEGRYAGDEKSTPLRRLCVGLYTRPEEPYTLVRADFVLPEPSRQYFTERLSRSRSGDTSTILFRSGNTDYTLRDVTIEDAEWLLPGQSVESVEDLLNRLTVQLHAEISASRATVQERGTDR